MRAPISFRVNPDVDPKTHPYISTGLKENKFGIAYDRGDRAVSPRGGAAEHRGARHRLPSRLEDDGPGAGDRGRGESLRAARRARREGIALAPLRRRRRARRPLSRARAEADLAATRAALLELLAGRAELLVFEPGRFLVGNAGVLLTRVEYLKPGEREATSPIVDAAMNDLIRPALYEAYHEIVPVQPRDRRAAATRSSDRSARAPTSSVTIARSRSPTAICSRCSPPARTGFAMSSNYNSRPRACEVMVDGRTCI